MGTNTPLDADLPDTDARLDTKASVADCPNDTTDTVTPALTENATDHHGQSRCFVVNSDGTGDTLDGLVADVTTITQSQCERTTDYADIEALVCQLPIDHLTFAAHDASAPYSGPYPMAQMIQVFLFEKINGWDVTALHDYLRAHPSLRRCLGFETLPNQSTF